MKKEVKILLVIFSLLIFINFVSAQIGCTDTDNSPDLTGFVDFPITPEKDPDFFVKGIGTGDYLGGGPIIINDSNAPFGASKRTIARLIKPSGYFNQKAERLKIISNFLLQNKNLEKQSIKVMREKLLAVKGIGPETADSIILYAFNKPSFVIDSYTKRIFSRIGLCDSDIDYHNLQKKFHDALPKKTILYNEYHALIVELAKSSCSKKPVCDKCPVMKLCKKSL